MRMMKHIVLKDLCKSASNRDDGTEAAVKLLGVLHEQRSIFSLNRIETTDPNYLSEHLSTLGFIIVEIPEDMNLSASFVDELIYRLDEKEVLGIFVFIIPDDRTYEKFQKVSTNREIEIKAIWQEEGISIKPSEKKTHEDRKIIIRDL